MELRIFYWADINLAETTTFKVTIFHQTQDGIDYKIQCTTKKEKRFPANLMTFFSCQI